MAEHGDYIPAYRTIRVTAPEAPVAALADLEAWKAREPYPDLLSAGGPVFGVAVEREAGGWELRAHLSNPEPQGARDSMAMCLRKLAHDAEEAGDEDARAEYQQAAERLDWETLDDLTVRGVRYRVIRTEQFIRMGPEGPEPPRPTDPDPAPTGRSHRFPDPTEGFVVDPIFPTGMSEGILLLELLALVPRPGSVPEDVRAHALRAARTHPGGVLLPPTFMIAENDGQGWRPDSAGVATSPQAARDQLSFNLRVMAPVTHRLNQAERAAYTRAADRLDKRRGNDVHLPDDRHLRVARVERLLRIGPDGPEGPRPCDIDSQLPVMVQEEQLRAEGRLPPDENTPIELDEDGKEMSRLLDLEEQRRARLYGD
ncbi:DUF5954 family protein [Kitasatospora sp. NPDC052896]|uniref:DUF5954 family protein n=1 Tax=Kitasatospora sp. NPDC052896 TaxID=3364061 RepID=UPI0037C82BB1